jgi:hypothetical protein
VPECWSWDNSWASYFCVLWNSLSSCQFPSWSSSWGHHGGHEAPCNSIGQPTKGHNRHSLYNHPSLRDGFLVLAGWLIWFGTAVLQVEPRAKHMLGKHSTIDLHPQPLLYFILMQDLVKLQWLLQTHDPPAPTSWITDMSHPPQAGNPLFLWQFYRRGTWSTERLHKGWATQFLTQYPSMSHQDDELKCPQGPDL